ASRPNGLFLKSVGQGLAWHEKWSDERRISPRRSGGKRSGTASLLITTRTPRTAQLAPCIRCDRRRMRGCPLLCSGKKCLRVSLVRTPSTQCRNGLRRSATRARVLTTRCARSRLYSSLLPGRRNPACLRNRDPVTCLRQHLGRPWVRLVGGER